MQQKILILLSFILVSCDSNANSSLDKINFNLLNFGKNPELVKLEKRRERWINADKCLKAMNASITNSNSNVEKLCRTSEDIHELAKKIGTRYSRKIVESSLEQLDYYEKQLNEGIIDKLPKDTITTAGALISMTEDHLANAHWQIDGMLTEVKTCNIKAQIARLKGTSFDSCEYIKREHNASRKQEDARHEKQLEALDYFRNNYEPSP